MLDGQMVIHMDFIMVNRPDKTAPLSIDSVPSMFNYKRNFTIINAKIKQIVFNGIIRTSVFELHNCFSTLSDFIHTLTNKILETFFKNYDLFLLF